jgi:hypothetical protein
LDGEIDPGRPALICDVGGVISPDLATIEALCRFRLAIADRGYAVQLRDASSGLRELLGLCGLDGALPLVHEGQSEQGEESVGVEKEIERGDPTI